MSGASASALAKMAAPPPVPPDGRGDTVDARAGLVCFQDTVLRIAAVSTDANRKPGGHEVYFARHSAAYWLPEGSPGAAELAQLADKRRLYVTVRIAGLEVLRLAPTPDRRCPKRRGSR